MSDRDVMKFALDIVKATQGQTSPNPAVGAVVVKDGRIVGFGGHLKAGESHAEVHALNMAGDEAEGGTIYVTLEPCSHFGKTSPCADLIIKKKVSCVVVATTDPNPLVAGHGIQRLKEAGLEVTVGILKDEAEHYYRSFFHYIKKKTPYVTMKMAISLDGKMATKSGESQWITSEAARRDGHYLRQSHDAILVGVGTVIADDPSLTTRLGTSGRNPIRVILDNRLRIPMEAKLLNDDLAPTWILTTNDQKGTEKAQKIEAAGAKLCYLPDKEITIASALHLLGEEGIVTLLVEGGPTVQDSFLRSKCINQVIAYIAPLIIGGVDAMSAFGGVGIDKLTDGLALEIDHVTSLDRDIKIVAHQRSE